MAGRPKGAGEETKQQLISVASLMFAERGYHGVGISEILSEANVTKGSAYFHFPGGKEDLAYVCMEYSAEMFMQMMEGASASSQSSHEAVKAIFAALIEHFESNRKIIGCPVATIGLEAPSDLLRSKAAEIYTHWTERIYALLVKFDIENELTRTLLMVVEGALLMAKIERSKKPIELAEACVLKMLPDKKRAT